MVLEPLNIQKIAILIRAAKKHQTDVRYCTKNILVAMYDIVIRIPNNHIRFIDEINRGRIVETGYKINALSISILGKLSMYCMWKLLILGVT